MKTTVANTRFQDYDIYIGRARGARLHFGNPASHRCDSLAAVQVATREAAVEWYDQWLRGEHPEIEPERRAWILSKIPQLKGRRLGCFCAPRACHGDVLARLADEAAAQ